MFISCQDWIVLIISQLTGLVWSLHEGMGFQIPSRTAYLSEKESSTVHRSLSLSTVHHKKLVPFNLTSPSFTLHLAFLVSLHFNFFTFSWQTNQPTKQQALIHPPSNSTFGPAGANKLDFWSCRSLAATSYIIRRLCLLTWALVWSL